MDLRKLNESIDRIERKFHYVFSYDVYTSMHISKYYLRVDKSLNVINDVNLKILLEDAILSNSINHKYLFDKLSKSLPQFYPSYLKVKELCFKLEGEIGSEINKYGLITERLKEIYVTYQDCIEDVNDLIPNSIIINNISEELPEKEIEVVENIEISNKDLIYKIDKTNNYFTQIFYYIFNITNVEKYDIVRYLCFDLDEVRLVDYLNEIQLSTKIDKISLLKKLFLVYQNHVNNYKRLEKYFAKYKLETNDLQKDFIDDFIYHDTLANFFEFELAINDLSTIFNIKPEFKSIKTQSNNQEQILSFKWKDLAKNNEGLKKLYSSLKSKGKIECAYKEFSDLFDNKIEYKQVNWLGNPTELIYLFYLLLYNERLDYKKSSYPHKILKSCFNYNGKNSTKIISSIKNDGVKPKSSNFFEKIVDSLSQ